jgi:hypothetical protein
LSRLAQEELRRSLAEADYDGVGKSLSYAELTDKLKSLAPLELAELLVDSALAGDYHQLNMFSADVGGVPGWVHGLRKASAEFTLPEMAAHVSIANSTVWFVGLNPDAPGGQGTRRLHADYGSAWYDAALRPCVGVILICGSHITDRHLDLVNGCRNTAYLVVARGRRSRDLTKVLAKWLLLNPKCVPAIDKRLEAMGFRGGVTSRPALNIEDVDRLLRECGPDAVVVLEQRHGDEVSRFQHRPWRLYL